MFVEVVRLLVVVMATATGHGLAGDEPLAGASLGAALGYVVGGLIGRALARLLGYLERSSSNYSAGELLVGSIGAAVAGGFGAMVGLAPLVLLRPEWGWSVFGLAVWIGAYGGFRVASKKSRELLGLAGLSTRPVGASSRFGDAPSTEDALLLDTSALIDGRLLGVAKSGFLRGDLLVPRFVLDELQGIADAQEPERRRRGRRGLEVVEELAADRRIRVHVLDDDLPGVEAVDSKLIALGKRLRVTLLTLDRPLAALARIDGVSVVEVDVLADSLRPDIQPGSRHEVAIIREGKEPGQGVGFLMDGSMIVVTDGARHLGEEVRVEVSSSLQTSVGRLYFATLVDATATVADD
ncbi:MAG: PIN domain nuclease [Actinomycetota bacterium]